MELAKDETIIEHFLTNHPLDAARIVENLKTEDIVEFLNSIPDNLAATLITYLNIFTSVTCLNNLNIQKTTGIIDNLPLQRGSMLLRHIPRDISEQIISTLPEEKGSYLNRSLSYPEGSVGTIMEQVTFVLYEDMSVMKAIKYLKKQKSNDLNYIYILSRDHSLTGVLSLNELIRSNPSQTLAAVMQKSVIKIRDKVHFRLILSHSGWLQFQVLPVVDDGNVLQGILKHKRLRDLEENSSKSRSPNNLLAASTALGELYRLGISSLIKSASDIYSGQSK